MLPLKNLARKGLSTHSKVGYVYTTEWHVCIYWTLSFDLHVATFSARQWGRKRHADSDLQYGMMVITYCKLPSAWRFLPHWLAAKSWRVNHMQVFSKCKYAILSYTKPKPWNVCWTYVWTANIFPYQEHHLPCWLLVNAAVANRIWWLYKSTMVEVI